MLSESMNFQASVTAHLELAVGRRDKRTRASDIALVYLLGGLRFALIV